METKELETLLLNTPEKDCEGLLLQYEFRMDEEHDVMVHSRKHHTTLEYYDKLLKMKKFYREITGNEYIFKN